MIRSTRVVTKRTPVARRGMVVAEHPLGAGAGAAILERGGNAVDAAVATAVAMTVVEPFMSTLAGGGTMLLHLARGGETLCVDFNVEAHGAATSARISWAKASLPPRSTPGAEWWTMPTSSVPARWRCPARWRVSVSLSSAGAPWTWLT